MSVKLGVLLPLLGFGFTVGIAAAQQPSFKVQPLAPNTPAAPSAATSRPPAVAHPAPPLAPAAAPKPASAGAQTAAPAAQQPAASAAQAQTPAPAAKAKTSAATKPASKTTRAVTPRPQPIGRLGAPLSKAEVFALSAPATLILIAAQDNRWSSTLGVVVSPQGAVVSDSRLLSGVEKGEVRGFLYDPSLSSDEDPLLYLRAHKEQAVPLQVVRVDPQSHLLMLQLPAPPPKKSYAYLDVADTQGVNVGLDVVVLRTRGRQTLAMMTGVIAARRPDMMEIDPPLTLENAGGPVLSQSGRLLAIATYSDKALHYSGQARSVEMVRELLAGRLGAAPVPSSVPTAMEAPIESRNAIEAVRIGFGTALGLKMDKKPALLLHSEFVSAMAQRGRTVIRDIESVDQINGIIKGLTKGSDPKTKVVAELFPILLVDRKGIAWLRSGVAYRPVPGSGGGQAAIDDQTGALYATDSKHNLIYYDEATQNWRISAVNGVAQVRASGGVLFMLYQDGRVMAADKDGKNTRQLFPRSLRNGNLEVSQGVLYLISDEGAVYRYRNKKWDQKGQPIAFAMQKLEIRGESWYGMDGAGRIFCSNVQRYIDRDGNTAGLFGVGKDLLVVTRDNNRFYYNADNDNWGPWSHW